MRVDLEDIPVMCVRAIGGLDGLGDAWRKLETPLFLKGRKFYGAYRDGEYRACVARREDDDPAALGFETWTIPGGAYLRRKLSNWTERTGEIGEIFTELSGEHPEDPTRPCIEFYRSRTELILLMPVQAEP